MAITTADRKRIGMRLCLPSVLIGAITLACFRQEPVSSSFDGVIAKVTDGDTVVVDTESESIRIRLAHIDAPEHGQAGAYEAEQMLVDLIEAPVSVNPLSRDKYGRLVATIALEGQQDINKQLVQRGLAWWYDKYSDDPSYGLAELRARRANTGIWGDGKPDIPPWQYRKERRQ